MDVFIRMYDCKMYLILDDLYIHTHTGMRASHARTDLNFEMHLRSGTRTFAIGYDLSRLKRQRRKHGLMYVEVCHNTLVIVILILMIRVTRIID